MIVNLPKLGPVEFPDNLTSEQYDDLVGRLAAKYDFKLPKPEASLSTIGKRAFMRSMGNLGIAGGDVLPAMVGSALGFEDYARRQSMWLRQVVSCCHLLPLHSSPVLGVVFLVGVWLVRLRFVVRRLLAPPLA